MSPLKRASPTLQSVTQVLFWVASLSWITTSRWEECFSVSAYGNPLMNYLRLISKNGFAGFISPNRKYQKRFKKYRLFRHVEFMRPQNFYTSCFTKQPIWTHRLSSRAGNALLNGHRSARRFRKQNCWTSTKAIRITWNASSLQRSSSATEPEPERFSIPCWEKSCSSTRGILTC